MSYAIQKSPGQILVTIRDELTVAEVKGFREALLAAVSDPMPVVIDASKATRIDLSILQILHSLQKLTRRLTIPECSSGVKEYLARAGASIDSGRAVLNR